MLKKVYDYFLGVLDRSFTVLITVLSEILFMYFGVHLVLGVTLFIADSNAINRLARVIGEVDSDIVRYSINIVVTFGIYCIIYSKDIFKRLIYIFTGRTDKEV